MDTVFAHSFDNAGAWHAPFLYPGSYSLDPALDGLSFDQRWELSQIVERRFNDLAAESGSSAVWKQIQTIVWGNGLMCPDGEVVRADLTTNVQLIEWRDQAINEVLGAVKFWNELTEVVEGVLL